MCCAVVWRRGGQRGAAAVAAPPRARAPHLLRHLPRLELGVEHRVGQQLQRLRHAGLGAVDVVGHLLAGGCGPGGGAGQGRWVEGPGVEKRAGVRPSGAASDGGAAYSRPRRRRHQRAPALPLPSARLRPPAQPGMLAHPAAAAHADSCCAAPPARPWQRRCRRRRRCAPRQLRRRPGPHRCTCMPAPAQAYTRMQHARSRPATRAATPQQARAPEASTLPPMASTSRTRRRCVRCLVVLKAMYSSRWLTPAPSTQRHRSRQDQQHANAGKRHMQRRRAAAEAAQGGNPSAAAGHCCAMQRHCRLLCPCWCRTRGHGRLVDAARIHVDAQGGGGALRQAGGRRRWVAAAAAAQWKRALGVEPLCRWPAGSPPMPCQPPEARLTGVSSLATVKPFDSLVSCVAGAWAGGGTASGIATPGRASVSGTSTREPPAPKSWARKDFLPAVATAGAASAAPLVEKARAAALGSCSSAEASIVLCAQACAAPSRTLIPNRGWSDLGRRALGVRVASHASQHGPPPPPAGRRPAPPNWAAWGRSRSAPLTFLVHLVHRR